MAQTQLVPGEFYHLYNRGTEKRKIFTSVQDYNRFLCLLYLCNSSLPVHMADMFPRGSTSWEHIAQLFERAQSIERGNSLVDINAYVLMPNHFHLLIHEHTEGGASRFMQKLMTGYTMYFNTRHTRSGALFQGKYKASHVIEDRYLKYLISYIHLNPIKLIEPKWKETGIRNKAGAEKFLDTYPYSSFIDFIGQERIEKCIVNLQSLPRYSKNLSTFKASVTEWLHKQE